MEDIKSLLASFLGAFVAGWTAKVVASLTDPIFSAFAQVAVGLGCIGVLFVVLFLIIQTYEDFMDYLAMGVFAVPAIVTLFLPWDVASALMIFSWLGLGYLGKDTVLGFFGR